jgi:predicted PurR-regulated permease PerM
LIFLFTFSALFLGFTILGESYAFLLALLTAAVDSLPILGMGIVLIPLAIYHFMIADTAYGIGVCAIYLLITLLRQILEPRILGAGMGVHPLLMLMSMYGGLRLFGIFGMLGAPFIVAMLKNLIGVWKKPDEETL